MAVLLIARIQILILLLYTAANPRVKAAVVEKSKKNRQQRLWQTKNQHLVGEGVFGSSTRPRKSSGFMTPQSAQSPVTGNDYPPDQWYNRYAFTSLHPGGVQFAMTDGSVRFIDNSIPLNVFRALGTRAGGEVAQIQ
jgi:prepilin-type processing-associated H-X9-DG protein